MSAAGDPAGGALPEDGIITPLGTAPATVIKPSTMAAPGLLACGAPMPDGATIAVRATVVAARPAKAASMTVRTGGRRAGEPALGAS